MTTTFPVAAPPGSVTTMLAALRLVGVPVVPANLRVLLPCVAPKSAPLTVTTAPTGPDVGPKLVMFGLLVVPPAAAGRGRRTPEQRHDNKQKEGNAQGFEEGSHRVVSWSAVSACTYKVRGLLDN
jgi:hypothetical protein